MKQLILILSFSFIASTAFSAGNMSDQKKNHECPNAKTSVQNHLSANTTPKYNVHSSIKTPKAKSTKSKN